MENMYWDSFEKHALQEESLRILFKKSRLFEK